MNETPKPGKMVLAGLLLIVAGYLSADGGALMTRHNIHGRLFFNPRTGGMGRLDGSTYELIGGLLASIGLILLGYCLYDAMIARRLRAGLRRVRK